MDALKYVASFWSVISESAPHIYISTLPFAPEPSKVAQLYLPLFPQTLHLITGRASHWPAVQSVLEGHTDAVLSVALSPDGTQIVSGSADQTIYVWDTETGDIVSGPCSGHTDAIKSVAFSPDGTQIVTGSDDTTICVWDAVTGKIVSGPFKGHTRSVWSLLHSHQMVHMLCQAHGMTPVVSGMLALAILCQAHSVDGTLSLAGLSHSHKMGCA